MNLGPDSPNTGDFDLTLRPGTRVGVYTLTVIGWNGTDDIAAFDWKVLVYRRNNGAIVGRIVSRPLNGLPGWASQPVIDSTAGGGRASYSPQGAVWKTTVREELISDLDA